MLFHKKFHIIQIFFFFSFAICKEYIFSLKSEELENSSPQHWQHDKSNSAINQNGLEIDVLQWRVIAENNESVQVDLINPVWKHYKSTHEQIILPKTIAISEAMKFREEHMVYIRITPWRIIDNEIETLINGKIQISVENNNVPISLYHPHLINGQEGNLPRTNDDEVQYLIICPNEFVPMAQKIADIHSIEVPFDHQLITKIHTMEQIIETYNLYETNYAIREYLINQIIDNQSLKFLLLLGDETHIPPILDAANNYPSDDYYTTPEIHIGDPQLVTGRIPINNSNDANYVANKIYDYIINPSPGLWRSKIALVADDMHRSCSINNTQMEKSHTIYTDNLFDFLNPFIPVIPYYGIHYDLQQTAGCTQPDLTQDIIQTINGGIALINYIGHGDNQSWGDEKFIDKSRDLALIHSEKNKLAIWVAGTCSFGNYYEDSSFMEELLIKENGAIAIVATTDGINYTSNWNFLESLFGINNNDGIEDFITNSHNFRLGELVWKAKNVNNAYKFHVFGDPALPLPFPKQGTNLINENISDIYLLEEQSISFTSLSESQYSSIQIRETEKEILKIIEDDSLSYTIPGEIYTQMDFVGFTNCFRIPQDAGTCENCATMYAYKEDMGFDGKIETFPNISILTSNESFIDFEGPNINLFQNNISIEEGSAIFPDFDVKITLNDISGINLLETIGHGIRYKFDANDLIQIHGNEFTFFDCDTGSVMIPIPTSLLLGKHNFYIEAWDGLNNKSSLEIDFDLLKTIEDDIFIMNKVYPFPNPFSNKTHFTMIATHFPLNIIINIFSINGVKINSLNKYVNECNESFSNSSGCFITIEWDGKDTYGHTIANGAYFYQLIAELENGQIFNNMYKLAKIK